MSMLSERSSELRRKLDLIDDMLEAFRRELGEISPALPWDVRKTLSYIQSHFVDPHLTSAVVRRACQLRNNNISSRFRCTVGLGIKECVEAMRLDAAKRLLGESDLEVYLIAMAVGYDHQETFFRAFQRQTGCTPTEWRTSRSQLDQPSDLSTFLREWHPQHRPLSTPAS